MAVVPISSRFRSLSRRVPSSPGACRASRVSDISRRTPARSRAARRGRTRPSSRSAWILTIPGVRSSGLDEPVLAVLATVDRRPFLGAFAPEQEDLLGLGVELDQGLIERHGLEREIVRPDDPFFLLRGLDGRGERLPLPPAAALLLAQLGPVLAHPRFQGVESPVQGFDHVQGLFDDDIAAALGLDVDLGLGPGLLDGEDDVDIEDVDDEVLQSGQPLLAEGLDLRRERRLPRRIMDVHVRSSMMDLRLRIWEGSILSWLRYLATVRRAMRRSSRARISPISMSLSGLSLSSLS